MRASFVPSPAGRGREEGHTRHLTPKRQDRGCRRLVQLVPALSNGKELVAMVFAVHVAGRLAQRRLGQQGPQDRGCPCYGSGSRTGSPRLTPPTPLRGVTPPRTGGSPG